MVRRRGFAMGSMTLRAPVVACAFALAACGNSQPGTPGSSALAPGADGGGGPFGARLPETAAAPNQVKTGQEVVITCTWADDGSPLTSAAVVLIPQGPAMSAKGTGLFGVIFDKAGTYAEIGRASCRERV